MSTFNEIYDEGRVSATALFNKINGMHVTVVGIPLDQCQYDKALYEARSVLINFADDVVIGGLTVNKDGTYTDSFEVIKQKDQKEQVFELMLNLQAEQKITKEYPLVNQINILIKAVQRLGDEAGLQKTPEFEELSEMVSYIDLCISTNQSKKEFYRDNPDVEYITDEQVAAETAARMEGGIHESLGPRPITGGSIFGTERR